jgi:hypothetical protein
MKKTLDPFRLLLIDGIAAATSVRSNVWVTSKSKHYALRVGIIGGKIEGGQYAGGSDQKRSNMANLIQGEVPIELRLCSARR